MTGGEAQIRLAGHRRRNQTRMDGRAVGITARQLDLAKTNQHREWSEHQSVPVCPQPPVAIALLEPPAGSATGDRLPTAVPHKEGNRTLPTSAAAEPRRQSPTLGEEWGPRCRH